MENGAHFGRFATKAWRISKNLVFLVIFLSKYAGHLPGIFIFDFFIEGRNFLANVRGSRFDFPLQHLSFIKYLDGNGAHFGRFATKAWRISKREWRRSRGGG